MLDNQAIETLIDLHSLPTRYGPALGKLTSAEAVEGYLPRL